MTVMLAAKKTLMCLVLAACAVTLGTAALSASALASTGGAASGTTGQAGPATHGRAKHHGEQIATWFGPGFYGQQTACGQTMTPQIVGVASRTLPCGTLVLVSYRGHELTAPVIDRGPYAHNGATWDLTWGAASALSIEETVWVKTKLTGHAPNTPLLGIPLESTAGAATVTPSGGTAAP
jgi:rare lipoprotein A (peptidoglycan hydrolase)